MLGITYIREKYSFTMQELADKIGVSKQLISFWEKGERVIKDKHLKLLEEYFKVDERFFNMNMNDINMLTLDRNIITNRLNELKNDENADKKLIKDLRNQGWKLQALIDKKKTLKRIEHDMEDEDSSSIYSAVSVLLSKQFKDKINKKLLYETIFAFQHVFIIEREEGEKIDIIRHPVAAMLDTPLKSSEKIITILNRLIKSEESSEEDEEMKDNIMNALSKMKFDY